MFKKEDFKIGDKIKFLAYNQGTRAYDIILQGTIVRILDQKYMSDFVVSINEDNVQKTKYTKVEKIIEKIYVKSPKIIKKIQTVDNKTIQEEEKMNAFASILGLKVKDIKVINATIVKEEEIDGKIVKRKTKSDQPIAVEVTFENGITTRSECNIEDTFDLDTGITICTLKALIGPQSGTKVYNTFIKDCHRLKDQKEKEIKEKQQEEERIARKKAKMAAKRKASFEKKKALEKERQIEIQKEAFIRAIKETGMLPK